MRRRVHRPPPAVQVEALAVLAARMVTLEDPAAALGRVKGAFVRLRPPEGTSPEEVSSWRLRTLAAGARAVRVLPAPAAALVPVSSDRSGAEAAESFREEALKLAEETGDIAVLALAKKILDEVGA